MKIVQKKICLLGDFAVGKTSLVRRFVEGRFDDKYLSTIGVKVSRKRMARDGYQLNLLIWDLVGGTEFSRREMGYLVGETLNPLSRYVQQLRIVNPEAVFMLVGNKVDLNVERTISNGQLTAVSEKIASDYLLTSAKTGEQVEEAFAKLAAKLEQVK